MKNVRIGNISYRHIGSERHLGEILCWYPNPYYGREKDYQWTDDGEFAYKDDIHCRTHRSCFVKKESCYVVAFVENCGDEEPDIRCIGSRFLKLNQRDFENYIGVCMEVFNLNTKNEENIY